MAIANRRPAMNAHNSVGWNENLVRSSLKRLSSRAASHRHMICCVLGEKKAIPSKAASQYQTAGSPNTHHAFADAHARPPAEPGPYMPIMASNMVLAWSSPSALKSTHATTTATNVMLRLAQAGQADKGGFECLRARCQA